MRSRRPQANYNTIACLEHDLGYPHDVDSYTACGWCVWVTKVRCQAIGLSRDPRDALAEPGTNEWERMVSGLSDALVGLAFAPRSGTVTPLAQSETLTASTR